MAFLFRCDSLSKSFGHRRLFSGISIAFEEGERTGLIGPNGAGKSTLLKILAGIEQPDSGTLAFRRSLRLCYVPQADVFSPGATVAGAMIESFADSHLEEHDRDTRIAILLGKIGFEDFDQKVEALSGGWKKRLAIAREIIRGPDVLLLDEPTNHLDLEGIFWLEKLLAGASFAFLVVSHDRYFLENVSNRTVELNAAYPDGFLSVSSHYSDFLAKKEEFLAAQASLEQSMAGRVRREIAWLRRGAQARTTKAKGRIQQAKNLMGDLADLRARNNQAQSAGIDFAATHRQTRKLIVVEKISKSLGGQLLFNNLSFTLRPGMKLGLIGPTGSGKTTLINLLAGKIQPDSGVIRRADGLKVVLFDQARRALDPQLVLREALSPGSETVVFRGQSMHITGWAKRLLFDSSQLDMPLGDLSGGEQSRVLIGKLMLQPADVLILDEPTNDLDIPSLEVLEESLADFPGALVLVTHDRYLLETLATDLIGLIGGGEARLLADVGQYEQACQRSQGKANEPAERKPAPAETKPAPKKLTYKEQRELEQMEEKIMAAEADLEAKHEGLGDPEVMADHIRMAALAREFAAAQAAVAELYSRWQDLEARRGPRQ